MAKRAYQKNVQTFNHVWLGDYVGDVEGALWTGGMIERCRIDEVPDLSRIVVAIDPAVTGGKSSDETGIVIAGRHAQSGTYYVLEDASLRGSPDQWIRVAIEKYREYQADRIIAEVNNGGDLVETLLRNTDRAVSYRAVRATRGKMLRAEPIAALYESNKVFHAERMRELEEQMIFYNGSGNISPDRLDALVWALTDLSQTSGQAVWRIN
jgi:predicted phage terminase large subunit-like protein